MTVWDFKNVGKNDNLLKVSMESETMKLDEAGIKIARSMLEVMDFEKAQIISERDMFLKKVMSSLKLTITQDPK